MEALNQNPKDKRGQLVDFMKKSEKQNFLRTLIEKMGWSYNAFARRWIWEKNDTDDEAEIRRFEEKFKKHLTRETTRESLVDSYIEFLFQQPEAEKIDYVKPIGDPIKDELSERFYRLSKKLNESNQILDPTWTTPVFKAKSISQAGQN